MVCVAWFDVFPFPAFFFSIGVIALQFDFVVLVIVLDADFGGLSLLLYLWIGFGEVMGAGLVYWGRMLVLDEILGERL